MQARLLGFADRLDRLGRFVGNVVAPLIFVMLGVILVEVIGRYFFNRPTPWAHDVSGWLQVAYIFLGGMYALQRGYMVRVDVIYAALPKRVQALIDLTLGTALFAVFAYVMISRGLDFALLSWRIGETSGTGVWRGPVWPAKFMIPLGVGLLTLAWIGHAARQLAVVIDPSRAHVDTSAKAVG